MRRIGTLFTVLVLAACGTAGPHASSSVDVPRVTRVEGIDGGVLEIETSSHDNLAAAFRVATEPDRAWSVLPKVYESLGLPGDLADSRVPYFGVANRRMPRRVDGEALPAYVDCGTSPEGPNALFYQVTLSIVTKLVPDEDGTRVETTVQGAAKPRAVNGHPVRCTSKGTLERLIADRVRILAAAGA